MNTSGQQELYLIKQELQNIINELESIAAGIHSDFEGIGNEKCASKITRIADQYRYVKGKLNNIDTSKVTEEFAKSHGGASSAK
jgi:glucose-6-phosphate-specific signal transduction histidine kinase